MDNNMTDARTCEVEAIQISPTLGYWNGLVGSSKNMQLLLK
jgi:hypothetical protein